MTNTPEAIRKALEPMGYEQEKHEFSDGRVEYHILYDGVMVAWSVTLSDAWSGALIHHLDDKSQTGARLLEVANDYRFFGVYLSALAPHDDVDAEIARMWLKVHGLEDPRSKA